MKTLFDTTGNADEVWYTKRPAILSIAAIVLIGVVYFASPIFGFYRLQHAAKTGDQDSLETTVDFPAVRDDLKAQINVGLAGKMQSDPHLKGNIFAAFGMMLATALVDKMVDGYLTPQAISVMVTDAKAPNPSTSSEPTTDTHQSKIETHYAYISLDRFRVSLVNNSQPDRPLSFVMGRRGLFSWQLIRIELPPTIFR